MNTDQLQDVIYAQICKTELAMVHARSIDGNNEDNDTLMQLEELHDRLSAAWNLNNAILCGCTVS